MTQPVHVVVAYQLLLDPKHGRHYGAEVATLPEAERLVEMARFDAESEELLETIADSSDVLLVSLVKPVLTEDAEDPSEAEMHAAMAAMGHICRVLLDSSDLWEQSELEDAVRDGLRAARRVRIELLTEQAAALQRVRELAGKWQDPSRQSIVIAGRAFGDALQAALDGKSP